MLVTSIKVSALSSKISIIYPISKARDKEAKIVYICFMAAGNLKRRRVSACRKSNNFPQILEN